MTDEEIAKVCHAAHRAYCEVTGDTTQPAWDEASESERSGEIKLVRAAISNPEMTQQQQHESWREQMEREGWKKGKERDEDKMEDPAVVPFAELPPEQRRKGKLFLAVVRALQA
jgi:hypothetical protein